MAEHLVAGAPDVAEQGVTVLKPCRYGRMLFFRTDRYIGRSLDLYGEFSFHESVLFEQILHSGDLAVDVGANLGVHSLQFAQLVGPAGRVFAFEPQRVIFQLLCANMALNEQFNVHAVHGAAGRRAGTLCVPPVDYTVEDNFGGHALHHSGGGELVPVITLDSLELPSLQLLKIDVEGMECSVLEGAHMQIAKHRPFLYVENDRRENSHALISLIADMGYAMWWHLPPLYNPRNFFGNRENVFGGIVSVNLLCVPAELEIVMEHFRRVSGPDDWFE